MIPAAVGAYRLRGAGKAVKAFVTVNVGALELGGSHVSACVVDVETWRRLKHAACSLRPERSRPELLGAIRRGGARSRA